MRALTWLAENRRYAEDAQCSPWEFAVALEDLCRVGVFANDLRWLVAKQYAEHALETTRKSDTQRRFAKGRGLILRPNSCFVLTDDGRAWAGQAQEVGETDRDDPPVKTKRSSTRAHDALPPKWDSQRRELVYGDEVVKRFRVPANNQEVILSVFQEDGWPARIDDPLSHVPDIDPKRRLHAAIMALNRRQKSRCIRFRGDGTGTGICWERRAL